MGTKKTLEKMESRIDKYIADLDDRVSSNTKSIQEIYDLVISTITKKRDDCLGNMRDVQEREQKVANEKKIKVSTHIGSIDQFLSIQGQIDTLTDLEILNVSKQNNDTLKLATKNAVECAFSLSVLPEIKKDVEITNFGKQLKNALREQESCAPKLGKSKKPSKRNSKGVANNKEKPAALQRMDSKNNKGPSDIKLNNKLNESNITEMSTPV